MALIVKDRVRETTTTTGTGTVTLGGAVSGFQSFSVIGNANTTYYTIVDAIAGSWEVGIGTYTSSGTTLARDTVLESSNAGSLVNFAVGTKDVFVTYPAERSMYVDGTTITPAISATLPVANGGTSAFNATDARTNLGSGHYCHARRCYCCYYGWHGKRHNSWRFNSKHGCVHHAGRYRNIYAGCCELRGTSSNRSYHFHNRRNPVRLNSRQRCWGCSV